MGITQKSPSLQGSPSADCGVFEVGERSEVGVLESPLLADCGDYAEIIVRGAAEIRNPPLSAKDNLTIG